MTELRLLQPIDSSVLDKETLRIYDVCDGCRRCFNLCPSFNTLLDRIDEYESDVVKLTAADHHRIVDECYYCKLCFNHCPYTPPHQYRIDFPLLMAVWKKRLALERGTKWRDRLLTRTDLLGTMSSACAPLVNWALKQTWFRSFLQTVLGVHRDRQVLQYRQETFGRWWAKRKSAAPFPASKKVALFASCLVNYQVTDVGKATVQVLEKNGVEEREYLHLIGGEQSKRVAEHTYDVCEYLVKLKREGALAMDFTERPGRIAYQVPCHLRDQNIGFKSKELMECAGAQVEVIEKCSGHDGSWSAKTVERSPVDIVASDCPLAGLQLNQAGAAAHAGKAVQHPIQIVRDAYGLPRDPRR